MIVCSRGAGVGVEGVDTAAACLLVLTPDISRVLIGSVLQGNSLLGVACLFEGSELYFSKETRKRRSEVDELFVLGRNSRRSVRKGLQAGLSFEGGCDSWL
jgi:hypothetical protein